MTSLSAWYHWVVVQWMSDKKGGHKHFSSYKKGGGGGQKTFVQKGFLVFTLRLYWNLFRKPFFPGHLNYYEKLFHRFRRGRTVNISFHLSSRLIDLDYQWILSSSFMLLASMRQKMQLRYENSPKESWIGGNEGQSALPKFQAASQNFDAA